MEFAQLKSNLKTKVDPAYLVYGTDHYLLYKAAALVEQFLPGAEVTRFDQTATPETVLTALQTTTFFATKRLIIYQWPEKASATALNEYLRHPQPEATLVILSFNEKNNTNLRNLIEVNCNPLPVDLLVQLIAKQVQPKKITQDAARYLVEATGGYYSVIDHEITKLVAFYPEIDLFTVEHLAPYVNKTVDYQIYELGTALLQRKTAVAKNILDYLLTGSGNEYALFGGVVSQFRRAYYATATRGDENSIAKILGCSPYAIKYSRRDFGAQAGLVKELYAAVLQLEYQIKSGQISAANALQSLIYR